MKKNILILIIIVTGFACTPDYIKNAIIEIETCQIELDSLNIVFEEINIDTVSFLLNYVNNDIKIFRNSNMVFPKGDDNFIRVLGDYTSLGKILKHLVRDCNPLSQSIILSEKQLKNLHHDISKKLIKNADTVAVFIQQEKDELRNIEAQLNNFNNRYNMGIELFDISNPKMDSLKVILKKQIGDVSFSKLEQ